MKSGEEQWNMAQVINVLLEIRNSKTGLVEEYDINKMGLISMRFDRYLGNQKVKTSAVLSELELMFSDKTGSTLLAILQNSKENTLRLKYGFDDNLSEIYQLNIIKINTTYNLMGCTVAVGAIAMQKSMSFPAEVYEIGTSIRSILETIARRNNWYIGIDNNTISEYIAVDQNIKLPTHLLKAQNEYDIDFIINKIKPICNLSAVNLSEAGGPLLDFFDVSLVYKNKRLTFYFVKNITRQTTKNLWSYGFGTSFDNQIIGMTNKLDQSYLINGITLQVPQTLSDKAEALLSDAEDYSTKIKNLVANKQDVINKILSDYNLPNLAANNFAWNIEFIDAESSENRSLEEIIRDKFEETVRVFNTIELEVIGNPFIQPGDLIEISVASGRKVYFEGYWKVVTISEEIGISGYTTSMNLVREITKTS
jgi:hypothetical protein